MKQCPKCNRTYADKTLNFCLEDGEWLVADNEPPTAIISSTDAIVEGAPRATDPHATATPVVPIRSDAPADSRLKINKMAWTVGGLAFFILVASVLGYRYYSSANVRQIDSIAVMPFVNESGNTEIEYLSDGITESLINSLSTLPNLSVKARNTVFRFKGKEIDERKIGQELSVQAVLFGRFTQLGDDLTLSLSLVDSGTGNTLWGEQYDRKIQDLPVLRNDIARDVARKLRNRLSNTDSKNLTKNYSENADALRLYFNGRYLWSKRTMESVTKSIEYFDRAIERDPNFALAYSGLADAYVVPVLGRAPSDVMPKAKAAAERALEIDDTLAEAHTSLARVLQAYDWNWAEAEKEYKRAMEIDPRYPLVHQWYGGFLERTGRLEEAMAERRVALALDPLSASANFELGLSYFYSRDYDRALEQFRKALELEPGFPAAHRMELAAYTQKGQYDLATAKIQELQERDVLGAAGLISAMAGRKDDAYKTLEELERRYLDRRSKGEHFSPLTLAYIYAALGEKDEAIEWLEKGYQDRAFSMQYLKVDPQWDKIRDDLRFQELMKKVGLPPD